MGEYRFMCDAVGGLCEICGKKPDNGKGLSVDHNHKTSVIRGMLCNKCNMALGAMMDSPRLLMRAAKYLTTRGGERTQNNRDFTSSGCNSFTEI